eukprot:c28733_g7_i1 orf=488-958(+)
MMWRKKTSLCASTVRNQQFGFINTCSGPPICVIKNLQACGDLHISLAHICEFISKLLSKKLLKGMPTAFITLCMRFVLVGIIGDGKQSEPAMNQKYIFGDFVDSKVTCALICCEVFEETFLELFLVANLEMWFCHEIDCKVGACGSLETRSPVGEE